MAPPPKRRKINQNRSRNMDELLEILNQEADIFSLDEQKRSVFTQNIDEILKIFNQEADNLSEDEQNRSATIDELLEILNQEADNLSEDEQSDVDKQLDLKHLAPVSIVGKPNEWPEPNSFPIHIEINKNFRGIVPNETKIFNNYYKYNKKGHFVWTNQLVIRNEIDKEFDQTSSALAMRNFKANVCDLKNPENSFYLKSISKLGLGLFAKHDIPKGECVGEYTGELITDKEAGKRLAKYERKNLSNYTYSTCTDSLSIDAQRMGNHTRFINHSCEPNCVAKSIIVDGIPRRMMITTEIIGKDEQLFLNYSRAYFIGMICECNTSSCFMPDVYKMIKQYPGGPWGVGLKLRAQQSNNDDKDVLIDEDEIYETDMQGDMPGVEMIEMSEENKVLRKQLTGSYNDKLECFDERDNENDDESSSDDSSEFSEEFDDHIMYYAEREQQRRKKRGRSSSSDEYY